MDVERSRFPSGRSVGNCRQDAKRLAKAESITLHLALDRISVENGAALPWDKAIAAIAAGQLEPPTTRSAPGSARRRISPADIHFALKQYPNLTHFGMGISRIPPGSDFAAELKRGQLELLEAVGEVELCCQFLDHVEKRKSIDTRGSSSYGLKHQVEVFQRAKLDRPENAYVSNGAFICAAVIMGFEILQPPRGGPNVWFNMSRRSPVFEWRRRHDGDHWLSPADAAKQAALAQRLGVYSQKGAYDSDRFRPSPNTSVAAQA